MGKQPFLTRHQQGIVKRYYEHADSRVLQGLQELVGDLALESDGAKREKLWQKARTLLASTTLDPAKAEALLTSKNVERLAQVAADFASGKLAVRPKPPAT